MSVIERINETLQIIYMFVPQEIVILILAGFLSLFIFGNQGTEEYAKQKGKNQKHD